ncbi:MAG: ATPase, T2SS/T4P/T4SS family [Candidatus Brocadiia bacterium]|nr:ATPase, T2SS/T4P/T4SS family [Candidatus Brocadiia bacterium]
MPDEGLQDVLAHAQAETRQQLNDAIEKQQKTGRRLMDILRSDLDGEMFRGIWSWLNESVEIGAGKKKKKVKDVLQEGGWMTTSEWEEAEKSGEAFDPAFGRVLVESGDITEEQLHEALAQQDRSGQSFWRILVNRGLVTPKQIADARKSAEREAPAAIGEDALTQVLLRTGLVTQEQCAKVLDEKQRNGRDMLQALIDSNAVRKDELGPALSKELGVPYVDLKQTKPQPDAVSLLPDDLARQHRMIPVSMSGGTVQLAMANPQDTAARDLFHMTANLHVERALAFEKDVLEAIDRHYKAPAAAAEEKPARALDRLKAKLRGASSVDQGMVSMAESAGVINLVASVIEGAVNSRATDIHLEPQTNALRVRYRIDGMLYDIMNLSENMKEGVISRVKVLAGMDITERRQPQDGHFTVQGVDETYDLRVATLPTVLGEKMVLRLLNPENVFQGLRQLGFEQGQLEIMEDAIAQPYGMILVTGPIGSGKTTTLYACLSQVDILTQNVVTIEDPVEYQLPGINQVQVDLRTELTFASMLRSVLRQDADVMMVGEIRDSDTAHVAVRAAMTGHLVLSTLHTNDAVGAIITLRHLGVPAFLIPNSVIVVVAQRLVRVVCPDCRRKFKPPKSVLSAAGLSPQAARSITFYEAVGCEKCFQAGYRGRTGIYEIFRMSEGIKEMILQGAGHGELLEQAAEEGMLTLMKAGMAKVRAGVTTLEELLRVTIA